MDNIKRYSFTDAQIEEFKDLARSHGHHKTGKILFQKLQEWRDKGMNPAETGNLLTFSEEIDEAYRQEMEIQNELDK